MKRKPCGLCGMTVTANGSCPGKAMGCLYRFGIQQRWRYGKAAGAWWTTPFGKGSITP